MRKINPRIPALFVWIPRTGGSTVWGAVEQAFGSEASQRVKMPDRPFRSGCAVTTFQHNAIPRLIERSIITRQEVDSLWKFSIVRHPLARLVSIYCRLTQLADPENKTRFIRNTDMFHGRWPTWNCFFEWAISGDVPPPGSEGLRFEEFPNRQTAWLHHDDGSRLVNMVFRLEDIKDWWWILEDSLGRKLPLSIRNPSEHGYFWDYYTDTMRRRAVSYYHEELQRFGYVTQ